MQTEKCKIVRNIRLKKDYFQVDFDAPGLSRNVMPGQFVQVQVPGIGESIFRRPFSVFNAENGILSVVYKVVGKGTSALSRTGEGLICDLLGPLGNSFTVPGNNEFPVIAVGGYGSAATYILAKKSPVRGAVLIGAGTSDDILLADEYANLGFEVRLATDDGSSGHKGFVTELIGDYMNARNAVFYGCGPNPMMYAMARMFNGKDIRAELSLDHPMCCGVGACFACVVKIKSDSPEGWSYARSCCDGPVFDSKDLYLG